MTHYYYRGGLPLTTRERPESPGLVYVDGPRGTFPLAVRQVKRMKDDDFANWLLEQYIQRTALGYD